MDQEQGRQGDAGANREATQHQTLKQCSDSVDELTNTKITGLKYTVEGGHGGEIRRRAGNQ